MHVFRRFLAPLGALALVASTAGCESASAAADTAPPPAAADWATVDRLIDEQKLAEAAKRVDALEKRARAAGDDAGLARALVRSTQLAVALGGFETAVEALRAKSWPEEPLARAAVELYDAFALAAYLDHYGWEIAQRERVVAGGSLDLGLWTRDQIADEAGRAFARVWALGERLGEVAAKDFPYLRANDFPAGIRPTLRDAVAYLWAERLADSSHWSPAELQEIWKLDLAALADGAAVEPTPEPPGDAALHPLAQLAAVLGELERWHRGRGKPGAALEARLERLRILFDAFDAEEDRARLRAALADSLPELRREPWWAMGMARLASFWRRSDEPAALVRAREVALEGESAFPGSPGALACRREREEIEAPSFELEAMAIDAPGRRSVAVRHRNLARLHFRAYTLPLERFDEQPVVWRGWSEERLRPLLAGEPLAAWTVELPATADFRDHRTFVTPPLDARGRYLVVASAEPGFAWRGNRLQAVELALSDLVLLTDWTHAKGAGRLTVRALSGASGAPLAGAAATLYAWQWEQKPQRVAEATTDSAGLVELAPPFESRRAGGFAVVVRHGGDEARWEQTSWRWRSAPGDESRVSTLVFTDRAIYRPGQKLLWKTLTYEGSRREGDLRAATARTITLRLRDPNGEVVGEQTATTNGFGAASGELAIPTGRLLGEWMLESDADGGTTIAVEEYKRPTFEVTLEPPAGEPRLNRPVELTGEARYYFGLPVAAGRVAWRVVREPLWLWGGRGFGPIWPSPAPRTIASGRAELDAEGRFALRFTPEADERDTSDCGCFRYRVEAEVTDEGGETRTGTSALAIGRVAVRLVLADDLFLLATGAANELALRREDLDGAPRAGESTWRLVELAQPARAPLPADLPEVVDPERERYATPGDRLRPRWAAAPDTQEILAGWRAGREVARGALRHGEDGRAALALPALGAGVYRLVAETRDRHGEAVRLEHAFVAAPAPGGGGARLALPLELRFAAPMTRVGGTARLLRSDFAETAFFEPHLLLGDDGAAVGRVRGARLGHRVERLGHA
jgi:alpha-2-macroglobulin